MPTRHTILGDKNFFPVHRNKTITKRSIRGLLRRERKWINNIKALRDIQRINKYWKQLRISPNINEILLKRDKMLANINYTASTYSRERPNKRSLCDSKRMALDIKSIAGSRKDIQMLRYISKILNIRHQASNGIQSNLKTKQPRSLAQKWANRTIGTFDTTKYIRGNSTKGFSRAKRIKRASELHSTFLQVAVNLYP